MNPADRRPLQLLLFHGLHSSPKEFGLINHALRMRGALHKPVSIDGYTFGTRGSAAPAWRSWRSEACAQITACAGANEPVILAGLCMGGLLATVAALEVPEHVAGLVLLSPSFEFDGWGLSPMRHLRHLAYWTGLHRFFGMRERAPFGVKSEKIRLWIEAELHESAPSAAGPARVSLTVLREGERMLADARARLSTLRCPILIVHAREDEISSLAGVERVFDALPQADKELVVLENSYHMITIDNDRNQLASLLADFSHRVSASYRGTAPSATAPAEAAIRSA
jgi:carboxylesterase